MLPSRSDPPMKTKDIQYSSLQVADFDEVIALGNLVHGEGYLTVELMEKYYRQGILGSINTGFIARAGAVLVGFRLTFAAGQWQTDSWCSPDLWQLPGAEVAYFKCNTVAPQMQGHGIGGHLLQLSIAALKQQGARAGVAHLWQQSPGNAAVKYFSQQGGVLVKVHPDKWRQDSLNGYACVLCGFDCHCSAAEMILRF